MKCNRTGAGRALLCACSLSLILLTLWFTSCDKFKAARDSAVKVHPSSRERSPHRSRSAPAGPPRLAIILDDVGSDPAAIDAVFALHYPLTLSILPNHEHSAEIAEQAHRRGYQVMLHLPMESLGKEAAEPQQLRVGMTSAQVSQDLSAMLATVPHVVGVNNHQGSLATADAALMAELMPLLRERQLFFVDSRTTASTVAFDEAEHDGVRCAFRNVPFLDDVQEAGAIRRQLELAIHDAMENGEAVAIGHPHPETLRLLREMLPQVESRGAQLVHVSALVH